MSELDVEATGYLHKSIDALLDNMTGLCGFANRFIGNGKDELYGFFVGYIVGDFQTQFINLEDRDLKREEYEDLMNIIDAQKTRISDAVQDKC